MPPTLKASSRSTDVFPLPEFRDAIIVKNSLKSMTPSWFTSTSCMISFNSASVGAWPRDLVDEDRKKKIETKSVGDKDVQFGRGCYENREFLPKNCPKF
jgi:hypothetical protein